MIRVGLHVDEYATLDSSPEEEYEELEKELKEAMPEVEFNFIRDLVPTSLPHTNVDLFLFDIGGMCRGDWNGIQRGNYCDYIYRQVQDKPNTLFVPWSCMTRQSFRTTLRQMTPEWESDLEVKDIKYPDHPNLLLPDERVELALDDMEYKIQAHQLTKIKAWVENTLKDKKGSNELSGEPGTSGGNTQG